MQPHWGLGIPHTKFGKHKHVVHGKLYHNIYCNMLQDWKQVIGLKISWMQDKSLLTF